MKIRNFDYKKNIGLVLVTVGLVIYLLPFALVAIDNLFGISRPADIFVGNFGLFILTVSPALIFVGLLLTILRITKRKFRP